MSIQHFVLMVYNDTSDNQIYYETNYDTMYIYTINSHQLDNHPYLS